MSGVRPAGRSLIRSSGSRGTNARLDHLAPVDILPLGKVDRDDSEVGHFMVIGGMPRRDYTWKSQLTGRFA